jgi:hypothetical protein
MKMNDAATSRTPEQGADGSEMGGRNAGMTSLQS